MELTGTRLGTNPRVIVEAELKATGNALRPVYQKAGLETTAIDVTSEATIASEKAAPAAETLLDMAADPAKATATKIRRIVSVKSEKVGKKLPKEVTELNTDDLEELIDKRYEAGASQEELNLLEDEYAKGVAEHDQPLQKQNLEWVKVKYTDPILLKR